MFQNINVEVILASLTSGFDSLISRSVNICSILHSKCVSTQWAQILPECYMNVQFWSEYSGPIMNISALFRS